MAGRPKGSGNIAPAIRGAFLRALKMREEDLDLKDGEGLSDLMLKLMDTDPLGLINAVAKFTPKELMLEAEILEKRVVSAEAMTTDDWEEEYCLGPTAGSTKGPH